jgi:steroid 5-alpha reductase family enzyme
VVAILGGVADDMLLESLLIGAAVAVVAFAAVWAISVRINNYGLLDVVWSLSVAALAPIYALLGHGDPARRILFTVLGAAWSLRLGLYILIRVLRMHPREDARYRTLRERWPGRGRFFLFFELQALIGVIFSLPFLFASQNTRPGLQPMEWLGLGIAMLACAGEWLADWQAQRFKHNPANQAAVVDVGLWRYSRHPNYFFESMVWWGFCVAALDSPHGGVTVVCPLIMLYLLLKVTGIPLTEKHSLESRGAAYRAYQRRTSRFVPWFPKSS